MALPRIADGTGMARRLISRRACPSRPMTDRLGCSWTGSAYCGHPRQGLTGMVFGITTRSRSDKLSQLHEGRNERFPGRSLNFAGYGPDHLESICADQCLRWVKMRNSHPEQMPIQKI